MCRPPATAAPASSLVDPTKLSPENRWIADFDVANFAKEIRDLGNELERNQGDEDVRHLRKMIAWSNFCGIAGLLTMGFGVNPITPFLLSVFTFTRFSMIAHHTCHGGYDKCHPSARFNRFRFAVGSLWRRYCDWLDWMLPEAWNVEHNTRHHYNLSEVTDPDLVEENLASLRDLNAPVLIKYMNVAFFMTTWKWFYYAPNTYKELKMARLRKMGLPMPEGVKPEWAVTWKDLLVGGTPFYSLSEFLTVVVGPYFLYRFVLTPLPLLFLGQHLDMPDMYSNAVKNLLIAEVLTNIHAFLCIVTNHAGSDMYRFRSACRPYSGSFFLRQVIASANYNYGYDLIDFMQGYLNYQVEHHLWPNLSMRSYQRAAPRVREICEKYGVPYVKESVFIRFKKTIDIAVGKADMRWFPEDYENKYLELDAAYEEAKRTKKSS